jgi:hypothetical protein
MSDDEFEQLQQKVANLAERIKRQRAAFNRKKWSDPYKVIKSQAYLNAKLREVGVRPLFGSRMDEQ